MAETMANPYEELRRRQVQENKRKLEELHLHNLSAAIRRAGTNPKPAKLVMPRPRLDAPIRRSGRIAKAYHNVRAELPDPVYATKEEIAYAVAKAEELKEKLGSEHPTFIKPMSYCSANKLYSLYIPVDFRQHLPVQNERMVLVDEMNNEFDIFYNFCKEPCLGVWRGFSAEHKLAHGDCLVFQLIERRRFKVYIFRASSYSKNDH